jgi:hypothetical protein
MTAKLMTHKLYINAYFIISVAHPGTRTWRHACMVGVVAAAILTDCSSRKQNTFLIMINAN